MLTVNLHEPGCWSGFVEALVCSWEPAYASEYTKGEECLECLALRGELVEFPPGTNKMVRVTKPAAAPARHGQAIRKFLSAALMVLALAAFSGKEEALKNCDAFVATIEQTIQDALRLSQAGAVNAEWTRRCEAGGFSSSFCEAGSLLVYATAAGTKDLQKAREVLTYECHKERNGAGCRGY